MIGRRLLVLLVVLIGLTVLATAVAPRPAPPEVASEPPPAGTAAEQRVVRAELSGAAGASAPVVEAPEGALVELVVTAPQRDTVTIAGLDRLEAVDPLSPARFELFVDRPGRYEVRLEELGRVVGVLELGGAAATGSAG